MASLLGLSALSKATTRKPLALLAYAAKKLKEEVEKSMETNCSPEEVNMAASRLNRDQEAASEENYDVCLLMEDRFRLLRTFQYAPTEKARIALQRGIATADTSVTIRNCGEEPDMHENKYQLEGLANSLALGPLLDPISPREREKKEGTCSSEIEKEVHGGVFGHGGGLSGARFYYTHDKRFIFKTLKSFECGRLKRLLDALIAYHVRNRRNITSANRSNCGDASRESKEPPFSLLPALLLAARIRGIGTVLAMRNIFYLKDDAALAKDKFAHCSGLVLDQVFDLKGSGSRWRPTPAPSSSSSLSRTTSGESSRRNTGSSPPATAPLMDLNFCNSCRAIYRATHGRHRSCNRRRRTSWTQPQNEIAGSPREEEGCADIQLARTIRAGCNTDTALKLQHRTLKLGRGLREVFLEALRNDCSFLASINHMDYSLLVAIHHVKKKKTKAMPSKLTQNGTKPNRYQSEERRKIERKMKERDNMATGRCECIGSMEGQALNHHDNEGRMKDQDRAGEMEIEGEENETMEVYSCGLVDILATYGAGKKLDAALRIFVIGEDRRGLSSVPPNIYADRMVHYMELHTV